MRSPCSMGKVSVLHDGGGLEVDGGDRCITG